MNALNFNTKFYSNLLAYYEYFPEVKQYFTVITKAGNRVGSIIGLNIPENDDDPDFDDFAKEVENWLIDNEYV